MASGTAALMPELILDLARVRPEGGGLMANFAVHTQQLGSWAGRAAESALPPAQGADCVLSTHTHTLSAGDG